VRDVVLAVLSQVGAVGVNHGSRVVEEASHLLLIHGEHHHHVEFSREFLETLGRWAVRNRLGIVVVLDVLHLAEVRAIEQLLKTDHLRTCVSGFSGVLLMKLDHRFLVSGQNI